MPKLPSFRVRESCSYFSRSGLSNISILQRKIRPPSPPPLDDDSRRRALDSEDESRNVRRGYFLLKRNF